MSRGILDTVRDGVVRAVGVLANAPRVEEHAAWLREATDADVGVHLNATWGEPLTAEFRRRRARAGGRFPRPAAFAAAVLGRAMPVAVVAAEWRAQIERILSLGLAPVFVNSHEHMHALPGLFGAATELAREHGIAHVRRPSPDWPPEFRVHSLVRDSVLGALMALRRPRPGDLRLIGMHSSGHLGAQALQGIVTHLQAGRSYELLCHPGRAEPGEPVESHIRAFHAWETERAALTSPEIRATAAALGVEFVGFRDLPAPGHAASAARADAPRSPRPPSLTAVTSARHPAP